VDWFRENHPELLARVLEMERLAAPNLKKSSLGLGRRWSWTNYINAQK
jgi:hypothetical protein